MPLAKWKLNSTKITFATPAPLVEIPSTRCVFGTCHVACGITAACAHLWQRYSATGNDALGKLTHGTETLPLMTRARDREPVNISLTKAGKVVAITPEHPKMWPNGADTSLLLVQGCDLNTRARLLFLAQTRMPLFVALDVFTTNGGFDRLVLANGYKALESAQLVDADPLDIFWWNASESMVVMVTKESFNAAVHITVAGIASTVNDALALPSSCVQ